MEMKQFDDPATVPADVYDIIKSKFIAGFDYTLEPATRFLGDKLPAEFVHESKLAKLEMCVTYIMHLFSAVKDWDFSEIGDDVIKAEVKRWETKGGQCIYFSVLLHMLLVEEGVVPADRLSLVQGWYEHDIDVNYAGLLAQMMGHRHFGMHCWLTLDDAVIDVSIRQEERFFEFKGGGPLIVGEVPDGLEMRGWVESSKTIDRYMKRFAIKCEMDLNRWKLMHRKEAVRVALVESERQIASLEQDLKELENRQ